jgi:S-adenosylmethionine uptake transporter
MRSLSEIFAIMFFLTALFNMPLANVIALLQMLPLTVTLAGAVVLREPVGWRRMVAIMIGFCGMLLIVHRAAAALMSIRSMHFWRWSV